MSGGTAAITIRDLSYTYRSGWLIGSLPGLRGITLTVEEGESFGFLGHNGAGKTTTIKCMLGLIRPRTGSVSLFGIDSRATAARRAVGYLPEQPYFYDHLTVWELMEMYAALAGVPRAERRPRIAETLALTGLSARAKSPMRALSKGLTQRVALAQAIVHRPRLLVLDEPFSGLDPVGRKEFADLFLQLKAAGTTIFMSSHILPDVEFLCRRVSILKNGVLQGVFALNELAGVLPGRYELVLSPSPRLGELLVHLGGAAEPHGKFTRLVFEQQQQAEAALAKALALGLHIESYQLVHGGLEELFMQLVQDKQEPAHG